MAPEAQGRLISPVGTAVEELCQLIEAIDQTTDPLARLPLFRSLARAAETLGMLRLGSVPALD